MNIKEIIMRNIVTEIKTTILQEIGKKLDEIHNLRKEDTCDLEPAKEYEELLRLKRHVGKLTLEELLKLDISVFLESNMMFSKNLEIKIERTFSRIVAENTYRKNKRILKVIESQECVCNRFRG